MTATLLVRGHTQLLWTLELITTANASSAVNSAIVTRGSNATDRFYVVRIPSSSLDITTSDLDPYSISLQQETPLIQQRSRPSEQPRMTFSAGDVHQRETNPNPFPHRSDRRSSLAAPLLAYGDAHRNEYGVLSDTRAVQDWLESCARYYQEVLAVLLIALGVPARGAGQIRLVNDTFRLRNRAIYVAHKYIRVRSNPG